MQQRLTFFGPAKAASFGSIVVIGRRSNYVAKRTRCGHAFMSSNLDVFVFRRGGWRRRFATSGCASGPSVSSASTSTAGKYARSIAASSAPSLGPGSCAFSRTAWCEKQTLLRLSSHRTRKQISMQICLRAGCVNSPIHSKETIVFICLQQAVLRPV